MIRETKGRKTEKKEKKKDTKGHAMGLGTRGVLL